jgi:Mrp family chromosome partitioning ATPase
MSALDQAIIKAYAKDRPAAARHALDEPRTGARLGMPSALRGATIDQIYHDGTLYRVEGRAGSLRSVAAVPPPHLQTLPPTSPRRAVRRSVLRMLAANSNGRLTETPAAESPPRVARKVIIRHISHAAAPRPLGLRPIAGGSQSTQAELPPETIWPDAAPSPPPSPSPTAPPIPLNVALAQLESIEVRGDWEHDSAVAPMMLVADIPAHRAPSMVVNVQLHSLEVPEQEAADEIDSAAAINSRSAFTAKSLDDLDEPPLRYRLDSPQPQAVSRPHARFSQKTDQADIGEPAPPVPTAAAFAAEESANDAASLTAELADELTFAEASTETADALASDLIPNSQGEIKQDQSSPTVTAPKPATPQWEIDKFHWPRTCERLFADGQGYLAQAGDKLQAAMQDGLKVLAITGSRRGEGRSTLALCLARAAANTGIQVAVMDADFARPQLGSKVGVDIAHGWQDAALGKIPLSEAAVKSVADNVTLLPLESSAPTRALSLADGRVTATIRAAAATFELLIIDLGPLSTGTALEFPPGEGCPFDAAIVVRDLRFATAAESEAIGHTLHDAGIEAVGIAENFVVDDETASALD